MSFGGYVFCYGGWIDLREGVNCRGCGAKITEKQELSHTSRSMGVDGLDKFWHEKLRPMAELACLVEEASCQ